MTKIIALAFLFSTLTLFTAASFVQAQTELPLTATASSSYWRYPPAQAVDGNLYTYWRGPSLWGSATCWLQLDCGNTYPLSSISIWWDSWRGATNYDIQSSQNGYNWSNLYTGLNSTWGSNPHTYAISVTARYVRIFIRSAQSYYPQIYEVKIYSQPLNQPPSAQASANPTQGEAPLEVQFTGSGADSDGTIVGYSWTFGDGGSSSQQNPIHTYQDPTPGAHDAVNYDAVLTVTDDDGATGTDAVSITITEPPNQPPTAQASASPTQGQAPLEVQFTGGGTDPDGTIVSYHWDFADGQSSNQQSPTHTYQNLGTYTATLTVTDNDGATDDAQVEINVVENQPPTAQASADPTSGEAPLEVQFSGSAQDPDGNIVSYDWDFGDGETSNEQNPTHTYQDPGVYTATLTVTDNEGATASAEVTITAQVPFVVLWQIPQLVRFQGRITDNAAVPLDGAYKLTFRIYNAPSGGNLKWQETQTQVAVSKGAFSVLLGSVTPLDLDFAEDYWLSIEIGNNGEMSPRQRITSVGYAYRAETVNKAALTYTGSGEVSPNFMETVYLHLEAQPKSIKLYLWGERSSEGGYPNGVNIYLDGVDKTESLLARANLNWGSTESAFGDGTAFHPLVSGAGGVSGTGALELSALLNWTAGEHRIEFIVTGLPEMKSGRLKYNIYIKY